MIYAGFPSFFGSGFYCSIVQSLVEPYPVFGSPDNEDQNVLGSRGRVDSSCFIQGVSKNQGPSYAPQNSMALMIGALIYYIPQNHRALMIGTPKKWPPNL